MHQTEKFSLVLEKIAAVFKEVDFAQRGYHVEIQLSGDHLRQLAQLMRELEYYLVFVSAVQVSSLLEGRYQFAHFSANSRILVRVPVDADGTLPTISDIFPGANWHERETRDFFGIIYRDHPNLVPLILPETSVDLKPLLKDEEKLKSLAEISWQTPAEDDGGSDTGKGKN